MKKSKKIKRNRIILYGTLLLLIIFVFLFNRYNFYRTVLLAERKNLSKDLANIGEIIIKQEEIDTNEDLVYEKLVLPLAKYAEYVPVDQSETPNFKTYYKGQTYEDRSDLISFGKMPNFKDLNLDKYILNSRNFALKHNLKNSKDFYQFLIDNRNVKINSLSSKEQLRKYYFVHSLSEYFPENSRIYKLTGDLSGYLISLNSSNLNELRIFHKNEEYFVTLWNGTVESAISFATKIRLLQ